MNQIQKIPIAGLGHDFIKKGYLPKGRDEYYLREAQADPGRKYRPLRSTEIKSLIANGNTSDNWKNVLVDETFNPSLVQQCRFYGRVRIGKLEPFFLEFHDVRLPIGLYNSSIISCDLGDNVVVNNVSYLSHYIVGNEVILHNVNEIHVSDHAKFGNGIVKEGEKESVRIWLELCNENGGRSIMPFDGMQAGDAWLWTRYRGDEILMDRLKSFTEQRFDLRRGHYGKIGDRCVIKNSRIIKDVMIGTDAYIKGANKLKNLTINSSAESPTQIGEGCEMVNGIIGFGCKAFYGVKAVRFILSSHSQLKYGARLINSFLGDNSTISCCEVLNSLIFPAHEQHHNNSFLCAALVMGQSNMAAGATIGSNHNSRGADGELIAGRGFWPGLCVSLKHNSRFASFTLIAKGDFPAELDISIPFSLVSNDVSNNKLVIMPGYWFMYNMYALARNAGKYESRDKRSFRNQHIEYDFLAPDSVNELFDALDIFRNAVGQALTTKKRGRKDGQPAALGHDLLEQRKPLDDLEILVSGMENSQRKVELVKVTEAYHLFKEMIVYYGITQVVAWMENEKIDSVKELLKSAGSFNRTAWKSIGGQLMPAPSLQQLIRNIHNGKISSWDEVHAFYHDCSKAYPTQKFRHALASLFEVTGFTAATLSRKALLDLFQQALNTRKWMMENIRQSRTKDYSNPFRKMVYETRKEMEKVIGALKDNSFIQQQTKDLKEFEKKITKLTRSLKE